MTFATDGYEVRPLFSGEEITRLQACISDHMRAVSQALLKPDGETEVGAPFDQRIERIAAHDPSFSQLLATAVCTDAHRAGAVQALAHDQRLDRLAGELVGCEMGDRLCRFRLNSPALPSMGQAWHSDVVRVTGPCSDVAITVWIPLSDRHAEGAGLELAAGRRAAPIAHRLRSGGLAIPHSQMAGQPVVTPEVPQGHGLLIHPFTPHRTVQVAGSRSRWSLVVWMKRAR